MGGAGGELGPDSTVFNCALNPAMRKKKKIPRVIPPPPTAGANGEIFKAFWKEPLPNQQQSNNAAADPTRDFHTQPYMGEPCSSSKPVNGKIISPQNQKSVNYYENDSSGEHG